MEETVKVKLDVTQVEDGMKYKGNISFDEQSFTYNLRFAIHLEKLDDLAKSNPEEVPSQIHLDVKNAEGNLVSLDEQARGLFLTTTLAFTADFYNNPQTRDSNQGHLGMVARGGSPLGEWGMNVEFSMSTEYEMPKSPQLEEVLKSL